MRYLLQFELFMPTDVFFGCIRQIIFPRWRKFSRDDPNAEQIYIVLRQAYETLNDKAKRLGYDRFGASVDQCKTCKTEHDYVWNVGFPAFWTHHLFNGIIMFVIFFVLQTSEQAVRPWRVLLHVLTTILEAGLLFSGPNSGHPLVARLLRLTAYQQVQILRSISMTVFVALQHFASVMSAINAGQQGGISDDPRDIRTILETMEKISELETVEARSLFTHGFDAFRNDSQLMAQLKRRMEKTANDMKLYEIEDVRNAYNKARASIKRTGKPPAKLR